MLARRHVRLREACDEETANRDATPLGLFGRRDNVLEDNARNGQCSRSGTKCPQNNTQNRELCKVHSVGDTTHAIIIPGVFRAASEACSSLWPGEAVLSSFPPHRRNNNVSRACCCANACVPDAAHGHFVGGLYITYVFNKGF